MSAPASTPPATNAASAAPAAVPDATAVAPPTPAAAPSSSSTDQNSKVFVGQIPQTCSEQELRNVFTKYGPVTDVMFLVDKSTGMRKGCGFVTFENESQALAARQGLNGLTICVTLFSLIFSFVLF